MPKTAHKHFKEDLARAEALLEHAKNAGGMAATVKADILRSSWMFGVGAVDAYLCDAYTYLVGSTLIAKDRQRAVRLEPAVLGITLPVHAYLSDYSARERWRWRTAARRMMDEKNILNVGAVESLFNPFLPKGDKLYYSVIVEWVGNAPDKKRLFGVKDSVFSRLGEKEKKGRRDKFIKKMRKRLDGVIFQRRHDCIHNCDRPKVRLQPMDDSDVVEDVLSDLGYFVNSIEAHLDSKFRKFLTDKGFNRQTVVASTD